MTSARLGGLYFAIGLLLLSACPAVADARPGIMVDVYRAHLLQMKQVVADCKAAPGSEQCNPNRVGADEVVQEAAARGSRSRLVDYAWLRQTLGDASATSGFKQDPGQRRKQVQGELEDATRRLEADTASLQTSEAPAVPAMQHARPILDQVLSASEFHNVRQPSLFDQWLDGLARWLDRKLSGVAGARGFSPALIRAMVYGTIVFCLTLLAWWYARQVRRQRRMRSDVSAGPDPSAASAVDWQERLREAQALAAQCDWRGAVHYVYWAAISRLESAGNWPADRARTPREYLHLLPASHRKRGDLATLTRSFESIWYGHRDAQQADYESASALLDRLAAQ